MGVQDFCQSVLGTRTASVATKEEKSGRRTRLSESQKNGLKAMISSILGSHKDGLNRNDIAKAVSNEQLATVGVERGELANKLRQPLGELVTDNKNHTVGEKRLMKYLAGSGPRKK
jgi:hypothetical protein